MLNRFKIELFIGAQLQQADRITDRIFVDEELGVLGLAFVVLRSKVSQDRRFCDTFFAKATWVKALLVVVDKHMPEGPQVLLRLSLVPDTICYVVGAGTWHEHRLDMGLVGAFPPVTEHFPLEILPVEAVKVVACFQFFYFLCSLRILRLIEPSQLLI